MKKLDTGLWSQAHNHEDNSWLLIFCCSLGWAPPNYRWAHIEFSKWRQVLLLDCWVLLSIVHLLFIILESPFQTQFSFARITTLKEVALLSQTCNNRATCFHREGTIGRGLIPPKKQTVRSLFYLRVIGKNSENKRETTGNWTHFPFEQLRYLQTSSPGSIGPFWICTSGRDSGFGKSSPSGISVWPSSIKIISMFTLCLFSYE